MSVYSFPHSRCIDRAIYGVSSKVLLITFVNHSQIKYYNVPIETWSDFICAESAGSYYNNYIKGKYPTEPEVKQEHSSKVSVEKVTVMKPVVERAFTITLTEKEAEVLLNVVGNSSGNNGLSDFYNQLHKAFHTP